MYNKIGLDQSNLTKVSYPLVGLGDKTETVLDTVNLPIMLEDKKHKWEVYAEFAVVDIPLAYNFILGVLGPKQPWDCN